MTIFDIFDKWYYLNIHHGERFFVCVNEEYADFHVNYILILILFEGKLKSIQQLYCQFYPKQLNRMSHASPIPSIYPEVNFQYIFSYFTSYLIKFTPQMEIELSLSHHFLSCRCPPRFYFGQNVFIENRHLHNQHYIKTV